MFQPVNSKVSFPDIEKKVLDFWRENRIFEKSIEDRKIISQIHFLRGPPHCQR